ncbi:MAG: Rrf2 family transcriptional regulator [Thermodesulfobacteriota bacterium]
MQVTKTLDYAVRSLTYMGHEPIVKHSMKEISEHQHIPINYLAKIMRRLVKKGIVRSMVGPDGGYTLRKAPRDISLRDIYEAIEGEIRVVDCMDKSAICHLHESCPQLPVWDRVQLSMVKILEETTLEQMLSDRGLHGFTRVN